MDVDIVDKGDDDLQWVDVATTLLMKTYFAKYGFFRQQIESYERFMDTTLAQICTTPNPLSVVCGKHRIDLDFYKITILPVYLKEDDGRVCVALPNNCRQRKITYQNGVVVDICQKTYVMENNEWVLVRDCDFLEVPLFKIPCMVRSKYCRLHGLAPDGINDFLGGYFIINGMEKTVQAQIKLRANSIHVFKATGLDQSYYAEVRSSSNSQWKATSSLRVNVGPATKDKFNQSPTASSTLDPLDPLHYRLNSKQPKIYISLPFMTIQIPVYSMCRLLGFPLTMRMLTRAAEGAFDKKVKRSDVDMVFQSLLFDQHANLTDEELIQKIGVEGTKEKTPEKRRAYIQKMLTDDVLPHLGCSDKDRETKVIYVVTMVVKVVNAYLLRVSSDDGSGCLGDDRDNWRFKKVDCTGSLIAILIRQLMRTFYGALKSSIFKAIDSGSNALTLRVIDGFINSRKLETNIRYHFATGAWTVMRGVSASACTGVCAPLTRITAVAALSALSKINCPVNREGKTSTPRLLHCSDWGNACCVETPEGGGCGLVLNFCALTHVRQGYDNLFLESCVTTILDSTLYHQDAPSTWIGGGVLIIVTGSIIGATRRPLDVVKKLKGARRCGHIPFDVSIVHYWNTAIHVNGDPGVCLRPVVIAENIGQYLSCLRSILCEGAFLDDDPWNMMIRTGLIEYIDTEEQAEHCIVATDLNLFFSSGGVGVYTHVEVDVNLAIMGITANLIPFADYNQSPRIIYQSSMGKQSIGCATEGFDARLDSNMYQLHYPQRPMCRTNMETILNLEPLPNGESGFSSSTEAVLMIATFDGFNQEDSILVNKASIDRGFARITSYKTYFDEINGHGNDEEVFGKVNCAAGMKQANYRHLDSDGFAKVGSIVNVGDVIIGKEGQSVELGPDGKHLPIWRDRSTVAKEPGIVDKVCFSVDKGRPQVRVRMRQMRIPIEGDKFASRHAQKGTIGRLVSEEDLPFTASGMKPDIIINPHGFVSRMTVGMLVEGLAGKACAITGTFCNATPFRGIDPREFEKVLFNNGLAPSGHEVFYDGRTGEKIKRPLFMGIVTYQRLRHFVEDKINSRARGSRHILTDQPMDGRSRGGGLRVGEMEASCIVSHGARSILHERMFISSDRRRVPVCRQCGLLAEPAHNRQFAHAIKGAEPYCRACNLNNCVTKNMPGAQKLLQQELQAVQCGIRNY